MLKFFPADRPEGQSGAVWADLIDPTPEEAGEVERIWGVHVPSRDELSEIESSSRLRSKAGALFMSTPMVAPHDDGETQVAPLGFVLTHERLVTIRFSRLHSFDEVAKTFDSHTGAPGSGLEVFVALCDEIVDRLADNLELAAAELRGLSKMIFDTPDEQGRKAVRANQHIRAELRQVGRLGDRLSDARGVLLGMARVIDYACEMSGHWSDRKLEPRMRSLRQDVASLDDYEVHLSDKVQFLLDAMVGLIGMAQNDVFKILTIVSIVGIPPTLLAGIYGMNFKYMPELGWPFGYAFGLAMIALSAVLPLIWFKWRGWF